MPVVEEPFEDVDAVGIKVADAHGFAIRGVGTCPGVGIFKYALTMNSKIECNIIYRLNRSFSGELGNT